jgi:predicted  nucleic acid-binding Zn-ribbon protein
MVKKQNKNPIVRDIEKLLGRQTGVILDAVDKKINKLDVKIDTLDVKIDTVNVNLSERIDKLDKRMDRLEDSMNELRNTLDKFLKRLTDFNDEFKIVKARLSRLEKIVQDKLGITID